MEGTKYYHAGAIPVGTFKNAHEAQEFINALKRHEKTIELSSIPIDTVLISYKFRKGEVSRSCFESIELRSIQDNGHTVVNVPTGFLAIVLCEVFIILNYEESLFDDDEI